MEKKIRQSMHRKKYGCHRIESFFAFTKFSEEIASQIPENNVIIKLTE